LPLHREEIALVMLSLADGDGRFTPVQIQKALFLASDRGRSAFRSEYHFEPYDYGPFDRQVYLDVEGLEESGLAQIEQSPGRGWKTYAATTAGRREAARLVNALTPAQLELFQKIVTLVRKLSFNELVSAIYRAYPPMRARSVFRD
jgi:uncharacterized protein